jgi:hypothetical protein
LVSLSDFWRRAVAVEGFSAKLDSWYDDYIEKGGAKSAQQEKQKRDERLQEMRPSVPSFKING